MSIKKKGKTTLTITIGFACFVLVAVMSMQFKIVKQTDITSIETMREEELRSELANWKKMYKEAEEQYKKITSDEKMMAIIEVRERARREMLQDNYDAKQEGIEQGKKEGIEQGIEHGKAEEKLSIAKKLKQTGMDIKQISEITGLAEEEIEKL